MGSAKSKKHSLLNLTGSKCDRQSYRYWQSVISRLKCETGYFNYTSLQQLFFVTFLTIHSFRFCNLYQSLPLRSHLRQCLNALESLIFYFHPSRNVHSIHQSLTYFCEKSTQSKICQYHLQIDLTLLKQTLHEIYQIHVYWVVHSAVLPTVVVCSHC